MDLLGGGRVVTIDVVNRHQGVDHPRIEFIDGSSTDPVIASGFARPPKRLTAP